MPEIREEEMLKRSISLLLAVLFLIAAATPSLACACCIERGYYEHWRGKPGQQYTSILSELTPAGKAELYVTAAGYNDIKGIPTKHFTDRDGGQSFDIATTFSGRAWRMNLDAGAGGKGSLVLPMPVLITKHAVDADGVDTGLGVRAYKELIVRGAVASATGIVNSAARAAKYELIFLGHGNGCDDHSDYSRWRLQIKGPRADFVLFGTFPAF